MGPIDTSPDILDRLVEHHQSWWGWALHCCHRDEDLAADVLQEAYARVALGAARFAGRSRLDTWFFGVLRLTALELARQRRRRRGERLMDQPEEETPWLDPASRLESDEQLRHLQWALSRLSERQRDILHLVFYHDRTVDEAADILAVTPGTARQHYHRGKQALRRLLAEPREESGHAS